MNFQKNNSVQKFKSREPLPNTVEEEVVVVESPTDQSDSPKTSNSLFHNNQQSSKSADLNLIPREATTDPKLSEINSGIRRRKPFISDP